MAKVLQYHLTGDGFSNRMVRVTILSGTEVQAAEKAAAQIISGTAKDVDEQTRGMLYRAQCLEEGFNRSLVSFSQPIAPLAPLSSADAKDEAKAAAHAAKAAEFATKVAELTWSKVSQADIQTETVDLDKIFTSKDISTLVTIYSRNHEVSRAEVDAIVGKALEVSTD